MTGDKLNRDKIGWSHKSDISVANEVRMLMREQLNHEFVCTAARDRIIYLSQVHKSCRNTRCNWL